MTAMERARAVVADWFATRARIRGESAALEHAIEAALLAHEAEVREEYADEIARLRAQINEMSAQEANYLRRWEALANVSNEKEVRLAETRSRLDAAERLAMVLDLHEPKLPREVRAAFLAFRDFGRKKEREG